MSKFKIRAVKATAGSTIPRMSETVLLDKEVLEDFTSWSNLTAQNLAAAATVGDLKEDEELIVIVKRYNPEEEED